ncbi:MAG: metallophosphoesterase [Polyangiales bacterium]
MQVRVLLFFAVLALSLGALNYYVFRRTLWVFRIQRPWRWLLAGTLWLGFAAAFGGRAWAERGGGALAIGLSITGFGVQLAVLITVALALPLEAMRLLRWCFGRIAALWLRRTASAAGGAEATVSAAGGASSEEASPATTSCPMPASTGRREFVARTAGVAVLAVGAGAAGYGVLWGRRDYQLPEVVCPIAGLSPKLDGYRLVQLSDIHFGVFVGEAQIRSAVELVGRARPDAIVLTGDLVDHNPAFTPELGRLIRRLAPLSRDGVFAVPGNHDYYAGVDRVLATIRAAGGTPLRNAHVLLGQGRHRLNLVGVDDLWAPRLQPGAGPDLQRALAGAPVDIPRVLLCHNPAFFPEAAPEVALQLSGHTHGGQVNMGIRPADWVLPYGYVAGEYTRGPSRLYVNRGFGTAGPPARVGAPPEVTTLVLQAA